MSAQHKLRKHTQPVEHFSSAGQGLKKLSAGRFCGRTAAPLYTLYSASKTMKVDIDAADNHDMCRSSLIQFDGHRVSSQSNKIIVCSGLKYLLGHACHALRFSVLSTLFPRSV